MYANLKGFALKIVHCLGDIMASLQKNGTFSSDLSVSLLQPTGDRSVLEKFTRRKHSVAMRGGERMLQTVQMEQKLHLNNKH